MSGIFMDKCQFYKPDYTLSNAHKAFWATGKTPIVLSCRNCSQGVTPQGRKYRIVAALLCWAVLIVTYVSCLVLLGKYIPEWSTTKLRLIGALLTIGSCFYLLFPPIVLFSFRFSKWVPVWYPEEKNHLDNQNKV